MLRITIGDKDYWNETEEKFVSVPGVLVLDLEYSLLAVSKWESKYEKPFLAKDVKSNEEILHFFKCMVLTPVADLDVLRSLSQKTVDQIQEYINSSQSATTFGSLPEHRGRSEIITSELIYYWMLMFNIPSQYELWHLNRLFSLLKIANIKQGKPKKMSRGELARRNRELNEQRKAQYGTRG
jgi:hypothetical protein